MLADACDSNTSDVKRCNMNDQGPSLKKVKTDPVACHGDKAGLKFDHANTTGSTETREELEPTQADAPAVVPKEETVQTTLTEEANVDIPETSFGPTEGLRIEVNWVIVDETTLQGTPTWFAGITFMR